MISSTFFVVFKVLILLAFRSTIAAGYGCYIYAAVERGCCFAPDGNDLRAAVSDYIANDGLNSVAANKYGAGIGDGCVDYVKYFTKIFSIHTLFNEPLNNWNTASALSMHGMFANARSFNQSVVHLKRQKYAA
jgi:hypothetical protein